MKALKFISREGILKQMLISKRIEIQVFLSLFLNIALCRIINNLVLVSIMSPIQNSNGSLDKNELRIFNSFT